MTTAIALWGAILSTILAIRQLTADWPRIVLARDQNNPNALALQFKNEGKHSISICKIRFWLNNCSVKSRSRTAVGAIQSAINQIDHGDFQKLIEPDEECEFVLEPEAITALIVLTVHWNSARLRLFPRIPLLVAILPSQIKALTRAST
jgi:hypothetical protein